MNPAETIIHPSDKQAHGLVREMVPDKISIIFRHNPKAAEILAAKNKREQIISEFVVFLLQIKDFT